MVGSEWLLMGRFWDSVPSTVYLVPSTYFAFMAQATTAPGGPAADLASPKPRGGGLNIVLLLLLLVQLAGSGALVALPWLRQSSGAAALPP